MLHLFIIPLVAVSSLQAATDGICTDTRCGGAAKRCCEGSPALQKKASCTGSVDCDSCCGWKTDEGLRTIRVMPMGDSITLGVGGGGYREDLGGMLGSNASTAGRWSYSGILYGGGGVHCGYNGQTIQWLEENIAEKAFAWQEPTHVMIMAGTNDMFFLHDPKTPGLGANATGCVARMQKLVGTAFSSLPNVNVLLSGVTRINTTLCANYSTAPWNPPNCPSDMQPNILQYNELMAAQVKQWRLQGKKVSFHDPNCLGPDGTPGVLGRACTSNDALTFNSSADYFTYGIHFSASGYNKMALAWKKALQSNW